MVDIMEVYKSINISIVTVMKNSEMLKFVPDHLKTKKMCKHAVKKIPFVIKFNKCVIKLLTITLMN